MTTRLLHPHARAAALLVGSLAVAVLQGCLSSAVPGSPPTATPVATTPVPTTATPAATAFASVLPPGGQFVDLTPGVYVIDEPFPVRITFTVPAGWAAFSSSDVAPILKSEGDAAAAALAFWVVDKVSPDPCRSEPGSLDQPKTVDELAAVLADMPAFDATEPVQVMVDGRTGKYVELTGPTAECGGSEPALWTTASGDCRCLESTSEHNRVWILDVDGVRLVMDAFHVPATEGDAGASDAAVAELQTLIDSVQIE